MEKWSGLVDDILFGESRHLVVCELATRMSEVLLHMCDAWEL